jgi:hypothetical protein
VSPADPPAGRTTGDPSFAIITPSYFRDFEHCSLLCESVLRYVPGDVHHYILVDRRDRQLFKVLEGPRTHLLLKEDVLPRWLWQTPFARTWWLSARSLPVRGWIIQQLTKLSVNLVVPADVYVFMDSGAFFVRHYDPRSLMVDGRVPLFRQQNEEIRKLATVGWHQRSARLLGLTEKKSYDTSYVGNLVYWRRDNLTKLQRRIETVTGRPWILGLCRSITMSEYVLYGMFVEDILKESSGQYFYTLDKSLNHWSEEPLSEAELALLKQKLAPDDVVVMINEKARIPVERIRRVFF